MTRQDLIDNLLLGDTERFDDLSHQIRKKLEIRDKFRTYPEEEADIEEFAQNSKNFIVMKLTTPFGEHPVFVDRSMRKEILEYISKDYLGTYRGLTLK